MNHWIAAAGALALAVAVTAQGTTLLHNAKAQVTTPCGASHYMRHITRQAESALQAGLVKAQAALETSNKLRVVSASKTGGAATAASILAANLASEAAKAIETIKNETKNFLAGFAAAAELAAERTFFGKAHKSLKALTSDTTENALEDPKAMLKQLSTEQEAMEALYTVLSGASPNKKPADFSPQNQQLKIRYFGNAGEKTEKLWEQINAAKTIGAGEEPHKSSNLSEVSTADDLSKALFFYTATAVTATREIESENSRLKKTTAKAEKNTRTNLQRNTRRKRLR
uniref:Variant surface glycoprotein 1125.1768 n=1 Tax=Trypanosoma brucei TaxID=5691 RepID=A0A1J0R7N5_9TRYP|nr:variant surface glycoprotein 1125.1768 [Trypanosoma brucei]